MECHERRGGARAQSVQRASQLPLSRAALTGDENRSARSRNLPRHGVDALHDRARPEQTLEPFVISNAQLTAQVLGFGPELAALQRARDHQLQCVEVDRFGQVIFGARAHCGNRGGYVTERGGHDYRDLQLLRANFGQQLHAIHVWHIQIGQDQSGRPLGDGLEGEHAVSGGIYLVPLLTEQLREATSRAWLIVDDQNSSFFHDVVSSGVGPEFRASSRNSVTSSASRLSCCATT